MPIRTASLTHQIQKNGLRLHLAMASRANSQEADQPASAQERALQEERRAQGSEGAAAGSSQTAQAKGRQTGEGAQSSQSTQGSQGREGAKGSESDQGQQAVSCRQADKESREPRGRQEGGEEVGEGLADHLVGVPLQASDGCLGARI